MSARSPFRSHLLQQWTNSRRSPIVVQQWLQQATIDENAEAMPTSARTGHRRDRNRRSVHQSSHQYRTSLSSVESSTSSASISMATATAKTTGAMSSKSYDINEVNPTGFSVGFPFDSERSMTGQNQQRIIANRRQEGDNLQKIMSGCKLLQPSRTNQAIDAHREVAMHRNTTEKEYSIPSMNNMIHKRDNSIDLQASHSMKTSNSQGKIGRVFELKTAIDRALLLVKDTDIRNRYSSNADTEPPFTFRKLLSSSRSGRQLIDLCFQVTLRATSDELLARKEQKRWSEVPAFLVAIVHNNQEETTLKQTTTKEGEANIHNSYKALSYSPPVKEQQLEDYASACAAIQRVIHALEKDGFAPEWVTGTIMKTPAFRTLVKAMPTDRVAALILVHDNCVQKNSNCSTI